MTLWWYADAPLSPHGGPGRKQAGRPVAARLDLKTDFNYIVPPGQQVKREAQHFVIEHYIDRPPLAPERAQTDFLPFSNQAMRDRFRIPTSTARLTGRVSLICDARSARAVSRARRIRMKKPAAPRFRTSGGQAPGLIFSRQNIGRAPGTCPRGLRRRTVRRRPV
jgi:hypothetical protein